MAGMKGFYIGLGAVAVVGAGALATAVVRGGSSLPAPTWCAAAHANAARYWSTA